MSSKTIKERKWGIEERGEWKESKPEEEKLTQTSNLSINNFQMAASLISPPPPRRSTKRQSVDSTSSDVIFPIYMCVYEYDRLGRKRQAGKRK